MRELTEEKLNEMLKLIDEMYEHYDEDLDEFIWEE